MKLISSIILFLISVTNSFAQTNDMKVHVINVGQGSATLIEFSCGVILVDTGGEKNDDFQSDDALMNYLSDFFDRRTDLSNTINLLIISHPHIDHTRGIKPVFAKYKIKNVITNGESTDGSGIAQQRWLQNQISELEADNDDSNDIKFYSSKADNIHAGGNTNAIIDPINCAGIDPKIKVLWGRLASDPGWLNGEDGKPNFKDQNNHSVVTKIEFGSASILFTGDLEEPAIASLLQKHGAATFKSNVYVVGHHGSKNGTTLAFLDAIKPEIATLSFGDPARQFSSTAFEYGHPNKKIIQWLSEKVSRSRTPITVPVGNGKRKFQNQTVTKAIYGVGWDNTIELVARQDGTWSIGKNPEENIVNTSILTNINSASKDALMNLPYVGETRAEAIINYRTAHPFTSIDQLDDVPGIGPATVELLRAHVTL